MHPRLLIVTGPTASGKTTLSLELAAEFRAEIIVADSVQVYRDFNIGSAKPADAEISGIPHHLMSKLLPEQRVNAGVFAKEAGLVISEIHARGKQPLVVGGTGLYIRSLLCGLVPVGEPDSAVHEAFRQKIALLLAEGLSQEAVSEALHEALAQIDSESASRIHPHDRVRIVRALEVVSSTGKSMTSLQQAHQHGSACYPALVIVLEWSREVLYRRINNRVDKMFEEGLVEEVQALLQRYPSSVQPFQSIGYRQVVEFLNGSLSKQEMIESIKTETRRFAKRQMTWWRNEPKKIFWEEVTALQVPEFDSILSTRHAGALFDTIRCFLRPPESFQGVKIIRIQID